MKNLLLTASLCVSTASIALAQLYVAPNVSTSTDTYIYASNVQLYVEDYISLKPNSSGATEASIYLRDQAQLIQGGSDNQNRGAGLLSVYQDSNSDSYDYNLWSSPVSKGVTGGLTTAGNRNYGLINFTEALSLTEARQAAITGNFNGVSSPLEISHRWMHYWQNSTQSFQKMYGSVIVPAGKGFIMKGTDVTAAGVPETQVQNYDFRGRPNSGDITLALPSSTLVGTEFENGNTLIGNPYPSALDLNLFFYDPDNNDTDGSGMKFSMIQFYDEDRTINSHMYLDNKAGFGTWTPGPYQPDLSVGVYNPGNYVVPQFQNFDNSGNPIDPVDPDDTDGDTTNLSHYGPEVDRRMAPIGQGFFIQSIDVSNNNTIMFKNSQRRFVREGEYSSLASGSEFRNSDNPFSVSQDEIEPTDGENHFFAPQIRINTYMGDSHMRQTLLILHDDSSDNFDLGWDAISPMDATSEMYFPIVVDAWDKFNPFPFVINAVPFDDVLKRIPITLDIEEKMNVVITGIEEIDLPTNKMYVFDAENVTYQEITDNESASFVLDEGLYEDRFFIVFRKEFEVDQEIIREANRDAAELVTMFQNNPLSQLEVANPEGYTIDKASIFDMRGRLVMYKTNLGDSNKLTFPTGTFSDGVYLVVLTTSENLNIDYKIMVKN